MTGSMDLSGSLLLRFTGGDRVRWLNGQVSADVRRLLPGNTVPACVCNIKGQLDALVWITATEDALWLQADASLREALPPRLERYIIADDVTADDVSSEWSVIHECGLTTAGAAPQGGAGAWAAAAVRLGMPGMDVWHREGEGRACSPVLSEQEILRLRMMHRIPAWGAELKAGLLPAEARLDTWCIAWDKGCYTGQEVISRMKMAGKTNKILERFVVAPGAVPPGGTLIMDGEQAAGWITSAADVDEQGLLALGYLKRQSASAALALADGRTVAIG